MKFITWLRSRLSNRYRAMSRYQQGMKNAKRHNHEAAVTDYTQVIEMAEAPPDIRAMALYNRALVYDAMGHLTRAIADLNRVLSMSGVADQVRIEARRRIARMDRTQARSEPTSS